MIRVNYYKRDNSQKARYWHTTSFGASGAVAACFAFFCTMNPYATLQLYMILPVPAMYLLYFSFAFEVGHMLFFRESMNISSSTHLAGLLFGVAAYRYRMFLPK